VSGGPMRLRLALVTLSAAPIAGISGAHAQELTGTLKKIHDGKTVTIGYRASSIPFSYVDKAGQPIGYSIDLCNGGRHRRRARRRRSPKIVYRKVTAETRIAAVRDGDVDLECGSTTANFRAQERSRVFADLFSPPAPSCLSRAIQASNPIAICAARPWW
jgi:ABC-type amino acid transport substrate-binding protein